MDDLNFVAISNARIAYKVCGSGASLILCTGFATNMDLWSTRTIELLQKEFRVMVFDYRGMGLSTNSDPVITISSMAEDLFELLRELNIGKTHILGWSMGGFVAQMFALNHPEKVNKLVLYASNYGNTGAVEPAQEIIDILSNPAAAPMELLGTLFPDDWLASHPRPWEVMPEANEPYNPETVGLQYGAVQQWLSAAGGSAGQLSRLHMPVLIICGEQDKVVPAINSSMLADAIDGSALIRVAGSGHGLMYQLPDIFANHVITFLSS